MQAVRALVRKWWKLEIAYADTNGYVLDHADGNIFPSGNEFCRQALHSKEGFRRCNESVKTLRDRVSKTPSTIIVRRCHLGFEMVAAPIRFAGELVGFIFTGGAIRGELASKEVSELFSSVREFSDAATGQMETSLEQVPRMDEAQLAQLSSMLEYAANEIMTVHGQGDSHQELGADAEPPTQPKVQERFGIVGQSKALLELFALLDKIVKSEATVLIQGESGTGKELIARAIHFHGPRAKKPFIVQNCSAFNDNLLESALFGHVRGAFTGAVKEQKGLFVSANGGTFFLDEIGDMSASLQVKLLRVLQEGTLTPVGATKPVKVNVRIVAASHRDLGKMVERGEFREDLYYRVNVLRVLVPPLRDRVEDLPMLAAYFLRKHHHGEGEAPVLAADTLAAFAKYRWPGNIRELENEIERLNVLAVGESQIFAGLISQRITDAIATEEKTGQSGQSGQSSSRATAATVDKTKTLRELVEGIEAEVIQQGLIRTHWNKSQLAKELGISRSNLIQKCSYYGLEQKNS